MKINCFALCIYLMLFTGINNVFGQNKEGNVWQLRIAPLNLIDPLTGVLQFGVQKRFSSRIAMSFDYGIKYNSLSYLNRNAALLNQGYSKVKFEVKYFTNPGRHQYSRIGLPYFSMQLFYFPQQYTKTNSYLITDTATYFYDVSRIHRNALSISFISGHEKTSGRVIFDTYFGAGIKFLHLKHNTGNLTPGDPPHSADFYIQPLDYKQGEFYRLHLVLGIKIGYMLNRKE